MTAPRPAWLIGDFTVSQRREVTTGASGAVQAGSATNSLAGPLRVVGILAFCQMILFVTLFLFFCAHAGAATPSQPNFKPELKLSSYSPEKARDPFGGGAAKSSGGSAVSTTSEGSVGLKLEGILYQTINPSAIVNGRLILVNKPTTVRMGSGEVEIKAIEITRDTVVLEVGGQKIELKLGGATSEKVLK